MENPHIHVMGLLFSPVSTSSPLLMTCSQFAVQSMLQSIFVYSWWAQGASKKHQRAARLAISYVSLVLHNCPISVLPLRLYSVLFTSLGSFVKSQCEHKPTITGPFICWTQVRSGRSRHYQSHCSFFFLTLFVLVAF